MANAQAPRDTVWDATFPDVAVADRAPAFNGEILTGITGCKSYSLRNGNPEDIEPYLLTSAIPAAFHWVPINGLAPTRSLECIDGFIRCYLYRLNTNPPADWNAENSRTAAIMLGASRAVIMNNFDLVAADINAQETAAPVLSVAFGAPAAGGAVPPPTYNVLLANNSPGIAVLTAGLNLSASELELVKVVMRSAQAIIPVQGLNLINDGHHYLSDKSKQSYKSFLAVEKQVWVSAAMKEMLAANGAMIRDVMWHKAGHPVSVTIKEAAATSPTVKLNLEAAKLGSATARLPAMEADIRAADTFLKVAESVDAIWATMGGSINVEQLRFQVAAVKGMPRSIENLPAGFDMGGGVIVNSRTGAITALKDTVARNSDKVALAFGFYMAMMEAASSDVGDTSSDTLRNANSLNRLRRNNVAPFVNGTELYKDYRAVRNAARQAGEIDMPNLTLNA